MEAADPEPQTNSLALSPAPCTCHRPSWQEVQELLELERRHWQRQTDWLEFLHRWEVLELRLGG